MKPTEAIRTADQMRPNMMSDELKLRFLNEVEARVHGEIIMKCEHTAAQEVCPVYTLPEDDSEEEESDELSESSEEEDSETEEPDMLVPDKYAMMYVYWLESRIDEQNQEYEKLNNDRALFDVEWNNFFDSYIQDHMPLTAAPYFQV